MFTSLINWKRGLGRAVAVSLGAVMLSAGSFAAVPSSEAVGPKTADQIVAQERQSLENTGLLDVDVPWQAEVIPHGEFAESDARTAFVRLDNQKITFMTKDADGKAQPFLPRAVEGGFWDLRGCGSVYLQRPDKRFSCPKNPESPFYKGGDERAGRQEAFRQMVQDYGFNTVQITVNWAEWDKTQDAANPVFDYTLLDEIAADAKEAGLKVFWVLFFHVQTNMPDYNSMGVYNLADEDGYSYGVQWARNLRKVSDFPKDANSAEPELYPEYWHPVIHKQITAALQGLAEHYRDSDTVIGYQVGNEEGPTGPYNNRQDTNPYFAAMKMLWSEKYGSDDARAFHRDLGLAVWQSFVEAMRTEDPYKPITTNFQSSDVDKDPEGRTAGWQNLDFYRDAGLDLIAPMYYGGTEPIRGNIDRYFGASDHGPSMVAQELPAFFPSEIGVSWERGPVTQSDVLDTLARGGVGFGLYSFGEMLMIPTNNMRTMVKGLLADMQAVEHELWSGQPVSAQSTRNIFLATSDENMTLTTLESDNPNVAVGLLWWDYRMKDGADAARPVTLTVKESGTYEVEAFIKGKSIGSTTLAAEAGTPIAYDAITMNDADAAFIKVTKK